MWGGRCFLTPTWRGWSHWGKQNMLKEPARVFEHLMIGHNTPLWPQCTPPSLAHGRKTFRNVCVFGEEEGGWTFYISERCLVSIRWGKETAAFPDNGSHSATPHCVLWITRARMHARTYTHWHRLAEVICSQTRGQRKPQWNSSSARRSIGPRNPPMRGHASPLS